MKNRILQTLLRAAFIGFVILCSSCGSADPEKGLSGISADALLELTGHLSSPQYGGRLAGSEGYDQAAFFVARQFRECGLEPMGDSVWFQFFPVEYNAIDRARLALVRVQEVVREYRLGTDFICRGMTGAGSVRAPVVFCGYGVSQPGDGYDDYAGVDVKNKIVMVLKYNPGWTLDGKALQQGSPREKANTAASHGALGMILVSSPNEPGGRTIIGSVAFGQGMMLTDFPQVHLDNPQADDFFRNTGHTLKELQHFIDSLHKPASLPLGTEALIGVEARYCPDRRTMNVVGLLEGSDPALRSEYLVLGAHLDHVGTQAGTAFFPGANDNASGVAALLTVAKAFHAMKMKPARSVIFVAFSAEESGLFGSKHFVASGLVDPGRIVAMLNMDCVAQGDSMMVGGGGSAPQLWNIAQEQDSLYHTLMAGNTWKGGGADAQAFFEAGIPTLYYNTTSGYKHLHMLSDTLGTLNPGLFEALTKNVFLTSLKIANGGYEKESLVK